MAEYKILKPNADGDYDNNARIDISVANEQLIFDVSGWNTLTLQAVSDGAVTVGSLALKIQVSNDGANPNDFPSGAVTRSTAGISAQLCDGIQICARESNNGGHVGHFQIHRSGEQDRRLGE